MNKKLLGLVIIISLGIQILPSYAANKEIRYNQIKGDYLITYSYNEKTPPTYLYNNLVHSFSHNGRHYQSFYLDTVTPSTPPIQGYNVNSISKTNLTKELKYFWNLSQSSPNFGQYESNSDESILAVEGRYAGKTFAIKIPNSSNLYLDKNVKAENLDLRIKTIDRMSKLYNPTIAKIFNPQRYYVLAKKTENQENVSYMELAIKTDLNTDCKLLNISDSGKIRVSGNYKITKGDKTQYMYLYVNPYIPNLPYC